MGRGSPLRLPQSRVPLIAAANEGTDLTDEAAAFSPSSRPTAFAQRFDLVAAVRHGWERFAELVPGPVADAVSASTPGRLVATLNAAPTALCHGMPDTVWDATVFWALCELGWNKALEV